MDHEGLDEALSENGNSGFAVELQTTRALGMQLRITV